MNVIFALLQLNKTPFLILNQNKLDSSASHICGRSRKQESNSASAYL